MSWFSGLTRGDITTQTVLAITRACLYSLVFQFDPVGVFYIVRIHKYGMCGNVIYVSKYEQKHYQVLDRTLRSSYTEVKNNYKNVSSSNVYHKHYLNLCIVLGTNLKESI